MLVESYNITWVNLPEIYQGKLADIGFLYDLNDYLTCTKASIMVINSSQIAFNFNVLEHAFEFVITSEFKIPTVPVGILFRDSNLLNFILDQLREIEHDPSDDKTIVVPYP